MIKKQSCFRRVSGVTLLEIMLVLAIAAFVIVMSIRYYYSTAASQQTNSLLSQFQAIVSASGALAGETGDYTKVTTVGVKSFMPDQNLNSPWGSAITVTGSASSYEVVVPSTPGNVCVLLNSQLSADTHYNVSTSCPSSGTVDFKFTYSPGA